MITKTIINILKNILHLICLLILLFVLEIIFSLQSLLGWIVFHNQQKKDATSSPTLWGIEDTHWQCPATVDPSLRSISKFMVWYLSGSVVRNV